MYPSDFENKCFPPSACLLSRLFQISKVQTKSETTEQNMMVRAKHLAFTLRIIVVHSLLERGVNYLLTGIMKNLVSHGKRDFEVNPSEY